MILTCLELSTGHLTKDVMDLLSGPDSVDVRYSLGYPAMTVAPYEYGVFVTVPPDSHTGWHALPECLNDVIKYAANLGIDLLRFEADGAVLAELPFYEW